MKYNLLNEEQTNIFDYIYSYSESSSTRLQLIIGKAGTGKTFLLSALTEKLKNRYYKKLGICSPTHRASRVIEKQLDNTDGIVLSTVHSMLNLRPVITSEGEEIYVKDKQNVYNPPITKMEILFVDEVPMLDDYLFELLIEEQKRGLKIIFVGDKNQIPPVNKLDSIPLLKDKQEQYKIKVHELNTIIRQKADNTIIKLANHVKENLTCDFFDIKQLRIDLKLNKNVATIDTDNHDLLMVIFEKYFGSEDFLDDSNYCKMLCWNKKVALSYSNIIRSIIFKDNNLNKVVVGERLIMAEPYSYREPGKKTKIIKNNEELIIDSYTIEEKFEIQYTESPIKYYNVVATDSNNEVVRLHILHEYSDYLYNRILNDLYRKATKISDAQARKMAFVFYYGWKRLFANFNYNYCVTAHKSQGSSYTNTIVHYPNIRNNPTVIERNRIFYTSITRSTDKLIILV